MSSKRLVEPSPGLRFRSHQQLRKHLGMRLEELRLSRSLNQPELAHEANVGLRQLQHLAAGTSGGSLETWHRLAAALDVALEDLFRTSAKDSTSARESKVSYELRGRGRQLATTEQLETLVSVARRLDSKTVENLIRLARNQRR